MITLIAISILSVPVLLDEAVLYTSGQIYTAFWSYLHCFNKINTQVE